jgi:tetratricopeptide (TPR) repeat protein
MEISSEQLACCRELCRQGLFLRAYELTEEWGPMPSWRGTEATVLGSRLAWQLGGSILGRWMIRRAWRDDPEHAEAKFFYAYHRAGTRGPYSTWRWMEEVGDPSAEESSDILAQWYALRAQLAGTLRDFDVAEDWLDRAIALAPDMPWLQVCRASLLEQEDRYEEALAAAQHALKLQPENCSALECAAHLMTLLDRDREAMELLAEGVGHVECSGVVIQLYTMQFEMREYRRARETLERCAALVPLADKHFNRWLASQRSETSYYLGDVPSAIEFAKLAGPGFFRTIAERLDDPERAEASSARLDVGFIRQHHMTCAPATLSAIGRYWSKPADHLQMAEEICYNGTPAYNERNWAQTHGWIPREFTVTETSVKELIDRGVPFTLTTVAPGNAHMQAVIGYDARRGTLWIRDPYWRNTQECIADKAIECNRAYGPRGMALVPAEEIARLDGLVLPDAAYWDLLHAIDGALIKHDRDAAEDYCRQLVAEAGNHRLSHLARLRLACYDANTADRLEILNRLLEITPDDPCLELNRLGCMHDLADREERIATYRRLCEKREAFPIFLQQYAQELRADARRHPEAIALLLRAIRRDSRDAGSYFILAHIYWDQRRFEEAMELYRFAACLNDKEESFADSYFKAAQWFKRTEEALNFLRRRFERFGGASSFPARTLIQAYFQWNRTDEALETVEEALRRRPEDDAMLLFAADFYLSCSQANVPRAASLLKRAESKSHRGNWLRTAARLASQEGRVDDAMQCWQELLALEPLAVDVHQAVAEFLAESRGKADAIAHLAAVVDRFPHHWPLHQLWLQWIADEPDETHESALRRAVASFPNNAWLRREWAIYLHGKRRLEEARRETEIAGSLEPASPVYWLIHGSLLRDENQCADAKEAIREAIRISVDYDSAIRELLGLAENSAERKRVLAFVKEELVRQVTFGEGLLAFRDLADGTLDPEALLAVLRDALESRPDLWHAWSACIQQLLTMDRREEAWEKSRQATERFPLLPKLWLDRASVCRARNDRAREREALETACGINPDWDSAVCALADFHERHGEFESARLLLERSSNRKPFNVNYHINLAQNLWNGGQRDTAFARIRKAVEIDPGYQRAWGLFNFWAGELGYRELGLEIVRNLTVRRPGEARSWFLLAEALDAPEYLDERLVALEKAIALNPRFAGAHDMRATSLAMAGRWEEARAACRPPAWNMHPPIELRGRAAWIIAQQGKLKEAIAEMRGVVADEPGYYWGWTQLWEWSRDTNQFRLCLESAEAIVRINPQYEVSLGYLGEARLLNKDAKGAREAFRRACELNPRYSYGGMKLFDLQLESRDWKAAAAALTMLQTHDDNDYVKTRAVQLASRQRDCETATRELRRLCAGSCNDNWPISAAVKEMYDVGWQVAVQRILEEAMLIDSSPPEVGRQWIYLYTSRRQWSCGKRLRELAVRSPAGLEAAVAFIHEIYEAKEKWRFFRFLRSNEDWLRKNTRVWGSIGYALAGFRRHRRLVRWMADWRQRKDAEAWMLVNLVEGLRALGRDNEAIEVSRHALTIPNENNYGSHRAWLAVEACCQGRIEESRQLLAQLQKVSLTEHYQILRVLAEAVVDMAAASQPEKRKVFREVQNRLEIAVTNYKLIPQQPARRRYYHRCLRLIAQYRGGLTAQLWSWSRWMASWVIIK